MSNQLKKSLAARVAAIAAAVVLLWLTVCFGILTILCIHLGAFTDGQLSAVQMLSLTYYSEGDSNHSQDDLSAYVEAAVNGAEDLRAMLQKQFSPEATNLRFTVTDENGEVIVTNNTGLTEQTAMASLYTDLYLTTHHFRYKVQKVFSSYNQIVTTDLTQFLQSRADYSHWYFTSDAVNNAYRSGMFVTIQTMLPADRLTFPDRESAEQFDYASRYGPEAVWEIVEETAAESTTTTTNADGYGTPNSTHPTVTVEVRQISETEHTMISLSQYYEEMQKSDRIVTIDDPALAQDLAKGIDVTIVGETEETTRYDVCLYLPPELTVQDAYAESIRMGELAIANRYIFLGGVFVLVLLTITAMIALCKVAGYVSDYEMPVCGWTHRIPYELLLCLCPAAGYLLIVILDEMFYTGFSWTGRAVLVGGLMLCGSALAVFMLYTTAVRVKTHHFWDGFFTVRVLRLLYRLCSNRAVACIALIIGAAVLFIANVLILPNTNVVLFMLLILMLDGWALLGAVYCIYAFEVLRQYAKRLEQGDYSPLEPSVPLIGVFRSYAESLMQINAGIGAAVAKQTKAERMRTALITNVSHDLKTPLTSIVNYVDLMKREPVENPAVAEYLEVLDRQSARLKKLTEDLVEASKASTGNLSVDLQPTNVQVLVEQLMGEYDARFAAANLTAVVDMPAEDLYVSADSRLIWRVFDNLLGNIRKYALGGTRVYFDVVRGEDSVSFTLRNISESALHLSPEELTERFVRGDDSRNTEGSGLGLSIAKDLIRLQNGTLELRIDGDLFKAVVTLPVVAPPADPDMTQ